MSKSDDVLAFLLDWNQALANKEDAGKPVTGPGLPPFVEDREQFVTGDCIATTKNP